MENALVARGLVKRFASVAVVHGVDLTVKPGEVTGYLGPNGSGKTVTVQMLTGLLQPSAGTIHYSGRDIRADRQRYRRHHVLAPLTCPTRKWRVNSRAGLCAGRVES